MCPDCTAGDHGGHRSDLGGICIGCACLGESEEKRLAAHPEPREAARDAAGHRERANTTNPKENAMTDQTVPEPTNSELRSEIKRALNRASAENGSDTPDHVLADYLLACLAAFDVATHARSAWYGHHQQIAFPPESR